MKKEMATLAGGCFWCVEAVFDQLKGVESVESGYMGGKTENPSYEDICTGKTGHAEVVQVSFDADQVRFADILNVFFTVHDPTTLNQQGNDFGTQYRSAIFYHSAEQRAEAERTIARLTAEKVWSRPIVTEVTPAAKFFMAEDHHQEYFDRVGARNPYCTMVVEPKVAKFRKVFFDRLKR